MKWNEITREILIIRACTGERVYRWGVTQPGTADTDRLTFPSQDVDDRVTRTHAHARAKAQRERETEREVER